MEREREREREREIERERERVVVTHSIWQQVKNGTTIYYGFTKYSQF